MKRYCQILQLPADEALWREYRNVHAHVWPEVMQGMRQVGILDMQLYMHHATAIMIMDTVDDFDFVLSNERLMTLPRQREWEAFVARMQGKDPLASSTDKWQLMDKIFQLE